jgi:hypothetical protein
VSNGNVGDWYNRDKKRAAILRVLRYLIEHPAEGRACIGNDARVHALFEDPAIGNIDIPEDKGARAIVLPPGEAKLEHGGSVTIELPGPEVTPQANLNDDDLLQYAINYIHWRAAEE